MENFDRKGFVYRQGFKYLPIKTNTKESAVKYKEYKEPELDVFEKYENISVMVRQSKITIVDIDMKDNGMKKWKELIKKYGDVETLIVRTPSGGLHYYFEHDPLLNHSIRVKGFGIDVINKNYIMSPPSKINGKEYKYIDENAKIRKMPMWLHSLLMSWQVDRRKEEKKKQIKKNKNKMVKYKNDIVFPIESHKMRQLLEKLPESYRDDYNKWWLIGDACKNSNNWEAFNSWSAESDKYDEARNKQRWNSWKGSLSANYIIREVNKHVTKSDEEKHLGRVRLYNDLKDNTLPISKIKEEHIKAKMIEKKNFKTFVVKSSQGTGKTTATVNFCHDKIKNDDGDLKILAIGSRKSLTRQHLKSFKKKNIDLHHYKDQSKSITEAKHISIQIDSLGMLGLKEDFSDTIVFLDEFNSMVSYLLSSSTLNSKRALVYLKLEQVIRTAKYILCVDADISDLSLKFIKYFRNDIHFIQNTFDVCKGKIANHYLDQNKIVGKLKHYIKNGIYFTACFDCKTTCDNVYALVYDSRKDAKFLKYTSTEGKKIKDINKEWKNKFVFYSPKIVYGLDFTSFKNQDVFVFIDEVSINPLQVVQQITRQRNIGQVHYWISNKKNNLKWETLQEVKDYFKKTRDLAIISFLMQFGCVEIGAGEQRIKANSQFFELFCLNEFYEDTFFANFHFHFKELLKKKGFTFKIIGNEEKKLGKETLKKIAKKIEQLDEERIEKILKKEISPELEEYYQALLDVCEDLNIDISEAGKYKEIIFAKRGLEKHWIICDGLKDDNYLSNKKKAKDQKDFKVKTTTNSLAKVLFTRKLEKLLNINTLEVNTLKNADKKIDFNDSDWEYYKRAFKSEKSSKPTTKKQLLLLLIASYKHLYGSEIILTIKGKVTKEKIDGKWKSKKNPAVYELNDKYLEKHLKLYNNRDESSANIQDRICKRFNLKKEKSELAKQEEQIEEYLQKYITSDDVLDLDEYQEKKKKSEELHKEVQLIIKTFKHTVN